MPQAEITESEGILTVRFTRDEKLNAISPEMTEMLWRGARAVAERDDLRAMVITATGRYFTAGIDLKAPSAAADTRSGREFRRLYRQHHLLYDELEAIEKPIVLAAQGPCLGAGLEMACSCDFRFASDAARFQLPEIGMGVIAGSGGSSRLTRLVGVHWAKWLAMAGRNVAAQQALAIGLVHDVFPADEFEDRVYEVVREIVALPAEALGAAKLAADLALGVDRDTARHIDRMTVTALVLGDEYADLGRGPGTRS